MNGDDLTLHLGGTWDDPGTCPVIIPDGASYQCQFSSIDVGGDPQTLMIWVNRHEAGDGVSLESWRQTIEDRWREDSEAAPGAQTLEVISTVGEAAYLVTGTGDYAGSTLSFYDGALDVRMQYAVDGPNGIRSRRTRTCSWATSGRLVAERLAMQAAAATDDVDATAEPTEPTEPTEQPEPSPAPVASAAPPPTAPPASPAPVPTAAPAPPTSAPVVGPSRWRDRGTSASTRWSSPPAASRRPGIVLLIPFPSALFNSTLEENYAEIRGWFRFRRRRRPGRGDEDDGEPGVRTATTRCGSGRRRDRRRADRCVRCRQAVGAGRPRAAAGPPSCARPVLGDPAGRGQLLRRSRACCTASSTRTFGLSLDSAAAVRGHPRRAGGRRHSRRWLAIRRAQGAPERGAGLVPGAARDPDRGARVRAA